MEDVIIGIVIPVCKIRFIHQLVLKILCTVKREDFVVCIVNDGSIEVSNYLKKHTMPKNVITINLSENYGFAGANNAGWKHLLYHYPSIKYLGSINDDTIPFDGWLDKLVAALKRHSRAAAAMPVMQVRSKIWGFKENIATWLLNDAVTPMVVDKRKITEDTFVPVMNGFSFLALREALQEVGYFDENYRNSCEDVDLSIKFITTGWRMVVCSDSLVFHFGGQSRFKKQSNTDILFSHQLLSRKWGSDLTRYNNIER